MLAIERRRGELRIENYRLVVATVRETDEVFKGEVHRLVAGGDVEWVATLSGWKFYSLRSCSRVSRSRGSTEGSTLLDVGKVSYPPSV